MIAKLFKSTIERLKDPSRSFRERVFILLTLITVFFVALALIGDIICGENIVEIIVLAFTVVSAPIMTAIAIKKNRVTVAIRIAVVGILLVQLPAAFYYGGGIRGGGAIWIIFAFLYTGLVVGARWKPVMLIILTAETIGFYLDGYFHPERVVHHSERMYYIDSVISIILVGIICCAMVWFVEWLFRAENKRAREETLKFEELNKSQNRFFSSMSHEIRTPINSILGLNEIILRQEDASDEIIKDAGNIQGAGKMLLSLVNDILDLSKIEAGKMDIIPVNYSVATLVSEIVNMIWLRAEQKGLEFKVEIDPAIPQELFGDEMRIKQILVNLLNNAVKYTKEGTVTLHIEEEDIRDDSVHILFSVSDTGMGIKQDALPYLFNAFERFDEDKTIKIEGTGLGLSIVKQLVDLMGGDITVSSVYTQGSTFTVSLWQKVSNPMAVGDIDLTNYGSVTNGRRYEASFTAPEARILIVDDNEMNLEVEKKLLLGTKMAIDTADSGEEALVMTTNNRYDIILMDHLMPGMSGIECMQRIRKQAGGRNNHVPIIVLTANAGSENRELYSSSGFDGYLVKPVSGQQLEETLLAHLPEAVLLRSEGTEALRAQMNTSRGYSRKVPIVITINSMCDLPENILRNLQIDTIAFKVLADGREYFDGIEADADEVLRYMSEGKEFASAPPSVTEFEQFFEKELKKAHQVIHITLSSQVSKEYEHAKEAAKAYGNVYVYDSGLNSSSMGIMALLAYHMSNQGLTPGNIIGELNNIKKYVHCSFVSADTGVLFRRGFVGKGLYGFMESIGMMPFMLVKDNTFRMDRAHFGDTWRGYEKYIDYALPKMAKPNLDFVFITYSDVSEDTLERIEDRVLSRFPFKKVIFQKACAAMSLSCGPGAFGIMYMDETEHPYNLEKLISYDEDVPSFVPDSEPDRTTKPEPVVKEKEWFAGIEGLDKEIAIENSGSEEAFLTVLSIFYNSIEQKAKELSDYFDKGDYESYTIKAHALKSAARLVGAMQLSKNAEDMEMAGKDGKTSYVQKNHQNLLDELLSFKEPLKKYFDENPVGGESSFAEEEQHEAPSAVPSQDLGEILVKSMYTALEAGAKEKNKEFLENTFKEMADYTFSEEHTNTIAKLKDAFAAGDYEEMEKILKEIN
ncbi:DegV family EDD domain-containing protein [Butyrivibrio sp. CB08]|uniref:DegV family protein n=1 Tax=Butyrivibrio sp. CB08 TaxID=2364879 RepID=UPI000EA90D1F|nr:DegV family protein [Butyrivibrio sp. CB08]RKM61125.1 DegV family EDD domain-containing protein [Butyrivibrio sp. CB08]